MDLGNFFQNLLDDASAHPAAEASEEAVSSDTQDAVETFASGEDGDFDFGSLLGGISGESAPQNEKLQLLCALKPYLRDARRRKLDRMESLLSTAYTVRGLLSGLGGILNV